ncbi:hypothetical protein [Polaribacter sp. Asnod1-A03]|uniref:hypothetical protein n=1 Tax=Polaribacter sp. Asnod1-A03 TaxID=3160581 RepID=UPI0038669A52
MKKTFLTLSLLMATIFTINAQDIADNAIGLRFSGGTGAGAEFSYQRDLGFNNRLEVDLGLSHGLSDFKAAGLYEWVWDLEQNFNWYAGAGGGIVSNDGTGVFAAGIIGIEYDFDIPLLLSLDYRPELGLGGSVNGLGSNLALAVKYQF